MPTNSREYSERWYAANRGRVLAQQATYRAQNRERIRERSAAYREQNRARMHEMAQTPAYKAKMRAYRALYRVLNPTKAAAKDRRHYLKNRERLIAEAAARRSANLSASASALNFTADGNETPAAGLAAYTAQQQSAAAAETVAELLDLLEEGELAVLELLADLDYDPAQLPAEALPAWERICAKARR